MSIWIGKSPGEKKPDGSYGKSLPVGYTLFIEKDQNGNPRINMVDNRTGTRTNFWPLEDRSAGGSAGYGGGPQPVSGPRPAPVDVPQGWTPVATQNQPQAPQQPQGNMYDPDKDDVPF